MAKKISDRMSIDREPERVMSNRYELEERDLERDVMNMAYQDPLYIDPSKIPDGYEYRWVRESCQDKPDTTRMVQMKRKGWTPVPSDRHPDMIFDDFFGKLSGMKGYIYYSGLILCERPKYIGDQERKFYEKLNYDKITSMPGTENFMGEPNMPSVNRGHTAVGRAYMVK